MREADSRAVTGRSPELLSTIETDVHAGSQSAKEDRSRRMCARMVGAMIAIFPELSLVESAADACS